MPKGIYKRTELSLHNGKKNYFEKGVIPWNKGITGVIISWMKGKKGKQLWHDVSGLNKKGDIPWNKGKKFPEKSGENHFAWKGGISRGCKTGYYSKEYKDWRVSVFQRDEFTCVECGKMGYITAHHIKSFAHFPELRYEISNGKTLCELCHYKTDNYKGRNKGKKLISLTKE